MACLVMRAKKTPLAGCNRGQRGRRYEQRRDLPPRARAGWGGQPVAKRVVNANRAQ